jgi:hypothetical protein
MEQIRRQRHVRTTRHGDRLAVVERLQLGELIGVLEDEVTDLPDEPAPVGRGHVAPRAVFEGLAGRAHGPVDVFGVPLGYVGERLSGRGVGSRERLSRRRVGPLPIDEQLPRGGRELFDGPVDGDSHEVSHLLQLW